MKAIIASGIVLAVSILPASAAIPVPVMKVMGAQFYSRCTNPPRGQETTVIALCESYVAGIADGLQSEGKMCVGPRMTADRLFPVTLAWLHARAANGGFPASVQIATGLRVEFPCRQESRTPKPDLDATSAKIESIVRFAEAVKGAMALFGM